MNIDFKIYQTLPHTPNPADPSRAFVEVVAEFFGLTCVVKAQSYDETRWSHRCGYLHIPDDHPCAKVGTYDLPYFDCPEINFDKRTTIAGIEGRWIGFDCNHWGDGQIWRGNAVGTWRVLEYLFSMAKTLHLEQERADEQHMLDVEYGDLDLDAEASSVIHAHEVLYAGVNWRELIHACEGAD